MNLESMIYKDYIWKYNPYKIEISIERNIKEHIMPFHGNAFQDYGNKKRIVKGRGEFFGIDCVQQYEDLKTVLESGGSGVLKIPGLNPFYAVFYSLNLERESRPNIVSYSFVFWEEISTLYTSSTKNDTKYHIVKYGETLWSIASTYGIKVSNLMILNSNLKTPNNISVGERVKIR